MSDLELRTSRRLPATPEEVFDAYTDAEMATRITVTFEADGDGTLMSVHQVGFPVPEVRDFFVAEVWNGALDRIEAYLAREHR